MRWSRRFLPPNQVFETRPDGMSVVQVLPVSTGRCLVRRSDYSILPPDDAARAVLFLAARLGPSPRATAVELAESVQAGKTEFTHAAGSDMPVTAAVGWFHDWLAVRIPAINSLYCQSTSILDGEPFS
jgi:hypothetical protein